MSNLPLVSVALCTYNGEKFLIEQLESLINQTYKNIEIIAVDDCSTDSTVSILNMYALKHNNFFVYHNEENIGFLRNFETALSYCKGDFIALCDQDDVWHSKKIELQVAAIDNNQLIYHDSEFIDDQSRLSGEKISDYHNFYRGSEPKIFLLRNCVSGHSILMRKELLINALPFKDNFYHDWWLTYVAVNIGSIDYIPKCLVQYRRHTDSSTIKDVLSKSERLVQDIKWLELCASYKGNKQPEFVKILLELYKRRTESFISNRFKKILIENIDTLYYIDTKSRKKKLKKIKGYFWGLKAKNIWYTYIKPNPEKVFLIKQ